MTNKEAYYILLEMVMPVDKENEALEKAIEALKKQMPKKLVEYWDENNDFEHCPICHKIVSEGDVFCSTCGQALDWSDDR